MTSSELDAGFVALLRDKARREPSPEGLLQLLRGAAEKRVGRACFLSDSLPECGVEIEPGYWLAFETGPLPALEDLSALGRLSMEIWRSAQQHRVLSAQLEALSSGYRQAEDRWRLLLHLSKDVIFLVTAAEGIVYVSPAATLVFGYTPEEIQKPRAAYQLLHPVSHPSYFQFSKVFRETGMYPEDVSEWCWKHRNGTLVYTENLFTNIRNAEGVVTGFMTIARDITARKQTELEIARAEAFSQVMTAHLHPDGHWLRSPPRLNLLLGYTDLLPSWIDLLHPQDRAATLQRLQQALQAKEVSFEIECRYCRQDGSTIWISTSFSPVLDPNQDVQLLLAYLRETTETRRAEQALREAHKLESMGRLAGGIAHDFNNLLTAILGNVTLAQLADPPPSIAGPLQSVEKAAQRAADLTRQMLAYSGKGRFVAGPVDINRLLQEIALLLSISVSKKARLYQDYYPNLPPINADESQVQQLVINLVTNASEALMDQAGLISVRTRVVNLTQADAELSIHPCPISAGRYVALSVSDTGCGMTPEVMERIFDPFFSTKGWGRGLGLSAMLGILRGHRAGLVIQSKPQDGSEFIVYFPLSAGVPLFAPSGRMHTILVADDIPAIRSVARRMLEALGYQVAECEDGVAVLEYLRENPETDLVLLDLTMPQLDGQETLLAMRKEGLNPPVVVVSGHDEREVQRELGLPVAGFLQKPFRMEELRRVVEGAIRGG